MTPTEFLPVLLRQVELRDTRTGRTYVPTGVTVDGKLLLSRTDRPADAAWEVSSLDGFALAGDADARPLGWGHEAMQ